MLLASREAAKATALTPTVTVPRRARHGGPEEKEDRTHGSGDDGQVDEERMGGQPRDRCEHAIIIGRESVAHKQVEAFLSRQTPRMARHTGWSCAPHGKRPAAAWTSGARGAWFRQRGQFEEPLSRSMCSEAWALVRSAGSSSPACLARVSR